MAASGVSAAVLCLCASAWSTLATSVKHTERHRQGIINGEVVAQPSEEFPFFALPTQSKTSDLWLGCGASIISPTFAMSAAHCFGGGDNPCEGPHELALWLGDVHLDPGSSAITAKDGAGSRSFRVKATLICHGEWDGKCSHGRDVVLLRLNQSTPLPSWVEPVRLRFGRAAKVAPHDGENVTAIGFGLTEVEGQPDAVGETSSALRKAALKVRTGNEHCNKVFQHGWGCSDSASEGAGKNGEHQLCALSSELKDTCSGDSGSPLLDAEGRQIGITSYGGGPGAVTQGPGRSCGDHEFPGIYSRVSAFEDFIRQHVDDLA